MPVDLPQNSPLETASLFRPLKVGWQELEHRIVLAPMTRIRADESSFAPTELTVEYYRQRASRGGLLISEAIHISPEGTPIWHIYQRVAEEGGQVPAIWNCFQMEKWREVVSAVHSEGAKFCCQLLHAGRVAQADIGEHPLIKDENYALPPVSSSSQEIGASGTRGDYNWDKPSQPPRALSKADIRRICGDYQKAARLAIDAGFDYVELHAAHGYLMDQFLADGVNDRDDEYGGSLGNRCRFLFEVIEALLEVVGEGRLGVRLSPIAVDSSGEASQVYFGVTHSNPIEIYEYAVRGLNEYPLAYLLLTEPRVGGLSLDPRDETAYRHPLLNQNYRKLYRGILMGAGGFTPSTAESAVADGSYDLIAFGRWFLSNPDLPERIKESHKLTIYNRVTFYGGGVEGYTDYPRFADSESSVYGLIAQENVGATLRKHN